MHLRDVVDKLADEELSLAIHGFLYKITRPTINCFYFYFLEWMNRFLTVMEDVGAIEIPLIVLVLSRRHWRVVDDVYFFDSDELAWLYELHHRWLQKKIQFSVGNHREERLATRTGHIGNGFDENSHTRTRTPEPWRSEEAWPVVACSQVGAAYDRYSWFLSLILDEKHVLIILLNFPYHALVEKLIKLVLIQR